MSKVQAIDHVQLAFPPDAENDARAFYSDFLGLTEVPKPEILARRGGLWFEDGPVKLHLGVEADHRPSKKAHVALVVRDLAKLLASALEAGIETSDGEPLPGLVRGYVYDPFGNRIELIEHV